MLTIRDGRRYEISVKKSRFIAFAAPIGSEDEARCFIDSLKTRFYDAAHHVYAFRTGIGVDEVWRSSDDGEPSQTAGRPVLEAIKAAELTNTAVVVVRYFGGVLLGKGGLSRAYAQSAAEVLRLCERVRRKDAVLMQLSFGYQQQKWAEDLLNGFSVLIKDRRYLEKVCFLFLIAADEKHGLTDEIARRDSEGVEVLDLGSDTMLLPI